MSDQVDLAILRRYELGRKLGSGAYGHVWKVVDRTLKQVFALKKVFNAFQHNTDAQRTYREVMTLRELDHPNVVRLHYVFKAENSKDLYLVFDYMEADLYTAIREKVLEEVHRQHVCAQLLRAVRYIHSGRLMHRDLKPSNVLINEKCTVKICDFGLVRSSCCDSEDSLMTDHVATRWYRAPQILLGSKHYSSAVDIWSLGCIFAELFLEGRPLFPGSSTLNQLQLIFQFTGPPSPQVMQEMQVQDIETIVKSIPKGKVRHPRELIPKSPPQALQLIIEMLNISPSRRPSVQQLFSYSYLSKFHTTAEKLFSEPVRLPVSDQIKLSLKEYRRLLYDLSGKRIRPSGQSTATPSSDHAEKKRSNGVFKLMQRFKISKEELKKNTRSTSFKLLKNRSQSKKKTQVEQRKERPRMEARRSQFFRTAQRIYLGERRFRSTSKFGH